MEERKGYQERSLRETRVALEILKFRRDLAAKTWACPYRRIRAVAIDI